MQNSHQTILIMSRNYVTSSWTRYEYEQAQYEMLNGHHKIIPVFIDKPEDIQIEDTNLYRMLKSVTYIVWPGEGCAKTLNAFWENLRMSIMQNLCDVSTKTETETRNL